MCRPSTVTLIVGLSVPLADRFGKEVEFSSGSEPDADMASSSSASDAESASVRLELAGRVALCVGGSIPFGRFVRRFLFGIICTSNVLVSSTL
mmetsp:Transcript_34712/g.104873  ORF Transcript_34712/g.104873 Transcript_34712/m.104873 type:complete len:93 (+) Transcript_34712:677-955(+)